MSKKKAKKSKPNNPVAKYMNKYNKAATHRDRKNDYRRNAKHKKGELSSPFDFGKKST